MHLPAVHVGRQINNTTVTRHVLKARPEKMRIIAEIKSWIAATPSILQGIDEQRSRPSPRPAARQPGKRLAGIHKTIPVRARCPMTQIMDKPALLDSSTICSYVKVCQNNIPHKLHVSTDKQMSVIDISSERARHLSREVLARTILTIARNNKDTCQTKH